MLVAFTIFALSFAAILQVFAGGLRNSTVADRALVALGHAESLLARAGIDQPLAVGVRSGRFEDGMAWREDVAIHLDSNLPSDALPSGMTPYDVTVAVTWRDGGKDREVSLSSLRLGRAQ